MLNYFERFEPTKDHHDSINVRVGRAYPGMGQEL